ncbi:MAG: hypothetical protein WCJ64_09825 [Rhodospirillaceae bacterium]
MSSETFTCPDHTGPSCCLCGGEGVITLFEIDPLPSPADQAGAAMLPPRAIRLSATSRSLAYRYPVVAHDQRLG